MSLREVSVVELVSTDVGAVTNSVLCSRSRIRDSDRCMLRSHDILSPWRQQSSPHEMQIRESEGGKGVHRVLVGPAVPHLGKAPQALHRKEGKPPQVRFRERLRLINFSCLVSSFPGFARRFTR